ncbi:Moa, A lectin from the mushroom marasmius Oreades in complex with the trisaccharide Galgalglcnac [Mycena leptocephala]|nr:Moa, A lectin from the mushroom marasmius Oreades in complex with the trisaccharide Galgalglcnac [Mycena leptocephala]
MSLPDGVYSISNAKAEIVLDLNGGNSANRTTIHAWEKRGFDNIWSLYQLWLVQAVEGSPNVYSLRNLRGGSFMDMSFDSDPSGKANGNIVYGYEGGGEKHDQPYENQKWELIKDGVFYKLRNVVGKTFLDLSNGNADNGTRIQTWEAATPENEMNQLWSFERRSRSAAEIRTALANNPYTQADFKSYAVDQIYFILDRAFHTQLRNANLKDFSWRNQIFDCDDFAWVHKAGVAKWGAENIKADGLSILCGFMAGYSENAGHAYNWTLSDDLWSILFFEPQNGQFSAVSEYQAAWGIF